uniref:Uncharacterized protein n=1 Tax=Glossina pallidipes TaxID=7398 RepID=A0A1B0A1S3_GLOPL
MLGYGVADYLAPLCIVAYFKINKQHAYVVQQMLKTPILYHQEGRIKACNKYNNNNKNNTRTNTFTATTATSPTTTSTNTTTTTINTATATTTTTTTTTASTICYYYNPK